MHLNSRTKSPGKKSETLVVIVYPKAIWKEVIRLRQARWTDAGRIQKSTREKEHRRWRCSKGLKDLRSLTSCSKRNPSPVSLICWKVPPKFRISKTRRLRLSLKWILMNWPGRWLSKVLALRLRRRISDWPKLQTPVKSAPSKSYVSL